MGPGDHSLAACLYRVVVVCMGGRAIFMRERNDGMRWRPSAALTKTSLFLPDARISVLWAAWNVQELPRRERGERGGLGWTWHR